MAEPRRRFRPDVQALRALAVVAVVTYHLWPDALPGGFVGVDVFYVISGYLITGQLVREAVIHGQIALLAFWTRRIRRLIPAACTVLAATLIGLLTLMPKVTWAENALEIKASALYVENWLLARHAVDYLAAGDSASLVQHYWSLSLEEQFYLCWPLLLLLVLRLPLGTVRQRVAPALILVLTVSFGYSVWATGVNQQTAFFATTTRGWEFAVGGLVAVASPSGRHRSAGATRRAAAWCGVAAILGATMLINGSDPFPGALAALPVAGVALLLWADAGTALHWTALPAVQWLGDNSYSIYLWHWPLIVAAPWVLHAPTTTLARLVIAIATLLLAAGTRRFIEDPIRYGRRGPARKRRAYATAALAITAIVGVSSMPYVGGVQDLAAAQARAAARARRFEAAPLPSPTPASSASRIGASSPPISCYGAGAMVFLSRCPRAFDRPPGLDAAVAAQDGRTYDCLAPAGTATVHICRFGRSRKPSRRIAVVGNSHARRLIPALDSYGRTHGWQILDATEINCMGVVTRPIGAEAATDGCVRWSAGVVHDLLAMPHLAAVIFASFSSAARFLTGQWSPSAGAERAARTAMLQTWSAFARHGVRVIVTEDVPGVRPHSDPECIAQSRATHDPCTVRRSRAVRPNIMDQLARAHPNIVTYLRLDQYFCDSSRCHGLIGGLVVYFDSNHLTATFSRSLAPYLGAQIAPLLQPR